MSGGCVSEDRKEEMLTKRYDRSALNFSDKKKMMQSLMDMKNSRNREPYIDDERRVMTARTNHGFRNTQYFS